MAAINAFSRAYFEIPPTTRAYMTASVLTTLAVQLEIISPFQLYFNPKLIFGNHQVSDCSYLIKAKELSQQSQLNPATLIILTLASLIPHHHLHELSTSSPNTI